MPVGRESGLVQRVRAAAVTVGDTPVRVVVGFSGGGDSVALLDVLAVLQRAGVVAVRAVHVDHGVRETSADEAVVVAAVGASLGIEVVVRQIAPERLAAHTGVGREEAMRRERYLIFAEEALRWGTDLVAVAHHRDDQAETVLLHLLRGSGLRGAGGMRPMSALPVPWWEVGEGLLLRIWRPLLSETAFSLRAYAMSLGVPIVDDPSNDDRTYKRNVIRHDLLPMLEQISPGAATTLARFADAVSVEDTLLESLAGEALAQLADDRVLERSVVLAAPEGLRRRVVWRWLQQQVPSGTEVSLERVDAVRGALEVRGGVREVQVAEGVSVMVTRDAATVTG